ncbi:NAD(P)/FAD-dependent oxidoreductase [Dactylosporangium aurantiacum]|uniref:NAD(P)/FAD-dependent oxidoreductase n=1 Tax=Dactylosporangium aurantiacum TaxID=35754 RepID=A0A9Q9IRN4_9ACTN|nr:NAD(P)/FAD-dependent oxidoreductase [Dactylosporangium aurantiacum]MDG6107725.1 NAD(P)/FAD-dependent oxidoreductase [Dactylosporangium aurantiacum]UWZ58685.1 NAD(P)/FAD-dependent oxidoreductase [Dactylosporangium aurantiacum]
MNGFDVIIIGGGAAGLSAALVLARARRRVAVVDAGAPRNAPAAHMHGFLGSDGRPPGELLAAGRREVEGYGGELIAGTVTGLSGDVPSFDVRLADGRRLRARRVLVTTGLRDEIPDVAGARERWGRDLLHCPYCHGYEVRDRRLGVLGGSPEAVTHAHLIRQWSAHLTFFTGGAALDQLERARFRARGIAVVEQPVTQLVVEEDRLTGVRLASGDLVPLDAVFVRPRFVANDTLLTAAGCAVTADGWVAVDAGGRTSVAGLWAAGNAVNPRATVITAAGEGSAAAIAMNNDLTAEDTRHAVDRLHAPKGVLA